MPGYGLSPYRAFLLLRCELLDLPGFPALDACGDLEFPLLATLEVVPAKELIPPGSITGLALLALRARAVFLAVPEFAPFSVRVETEQGTWHDWLPHIR